MIVAFLKIAVVIFAYPLLLGGLLWLIKRFIGKRVSVGFGFLIIGIIICYALYLFYSCMEAPITFIAPTPEESAKGGVGRMDAACDGPAGFGVMLYSFLIAPVLVVMTLVPTLFMYLTSFPPSKRSVNQEQEAS